MMKLNALILLAGLLVSNIAMAAWIKVCEQAKKTVYVNLATIQRDESLVKMWDMSDYKSTQYYNHKKSYMSTKTQTEYDCNERTSRIVSTTHYSEKKSKGDVVYSNAYFDKPWLPVIRGSVEDQEWKIACKSH